MKSYTAAVALLFLVAAGARGGIMDNRISGDDCSGRDEPLGCLAAKAVAGLDRASRSAEVELVPGMVSLVGEPSREARRLVTPQELEAELPEAANERSAKVLDMLYQATVNFLKGRSLRIQLPEEAPESLDRAIEEGRAKLKKKFLPILLLVGAKLVTLLPLAIGAIGLMALKALVVGKIALILAAIIAFQKFFSGGAGGFSSIAKVPTLDYGTGGSSGWSAGGSSSSGPYYRRSMDAAAAQDIAYSAHIPSVDSNSAQ